jgi:hypothetical protein
VWLYSLKATKGSNDPEYIWWNSQGHDISGKYESFLGKVMTISAWAHSVSAVDNVKAAIYHNGTWSTGSLLTTADAWTWLSELTQTINTSSTDIRFGFCFDGDIGDVAYISQPMLVFGSSIGEGNYIQPPGEFIWFETGVNSTTLKDITGSGDVAQTTLNIEADSNGKIPKGVKEVNIYGLCRDSVSVSTLANGITFTGKNTHQLSCAGIANDIWQKDSFHLGCDDNGDMDYEIIASNGTTFDTNVVQYRGARVS